MAQVRRAYCEGATVPGLLRGLLDEHPEMSSFDMMFVLMDAFGLSLGEVGCIDGWWPPDADAEIPDDRLENFICSAIEKNRSEWENR